MAGSFDFVALSIVLSACFILIIQRQYWRLTRILITVIISVLLVVSVLFTNFAIATAALLVASQLSLLPICIQYFDIEEKSPTRALIAYQFLSCFILPLGAFGVMPIISVSLRLVLPFLGGTLTASMKTLSPPARALFYVSSAVFAIFVQRKMEYYASLLFLLPMLVSLANCIWADSPRSRNLYIAQTLICVAALEGAFLSSMPASVAQGITIILTSLFAQTNASLSHLPQKARFQFDIRCYEVVEFFLTQLSRLARNFLGPVIMEWILIRIPAGLLTVTRMATRMISYTSLPRLIGTSIFLSTLMLILLLGL